MNIFFLDPDPRKCAEYHCDRHVIKMVTEYAQLLSMALWKLDFEHAKYLHSVNQIMNAPQEITGKKRGQSHYVHPCALWVQHSRVNYDWLRVMAIELGNEYFYRYGYLIHKHHSSLTRVLMHLASTDKLPDRGFTSPPLAMPEEYMQEDAVAAYRELYGFEKVHFATYTRRKMPNWLYPYWKTKYLHTNEPIKVFPTYRPLRLKTRPLIIHREL